MEKLIQQTNHSKSHFASVKTSYFSTKTLKYILNLVAYIHGHYENLSCLYQTPMNEESNTFTSWQNKNMQKERTNENSDVKIVKL